MKRILEQYLYESTVVRLTCSSGFWCADDALQRMVLSLRKFVDEEREAKTSRRTSSASIGGERNLEHEELQTSEHSAESALGGARKPRRFKVLDRIRAVVLASGGSMVLGHVMNRAIKKSNKR